MRSKLIQEAEGQQIYAIVLETGDEAMACLIEFAVTHDISAASFKAIGAFSSAELSYFDWETKEYIPIPVQEQVEVATLTGDIAVEPNEKPFTCTLSWASATAARLRAISTTATCVRRWKLSSRACRPI